MGPRVLITGVTGMVGSHLADFLLAEVPDVTIYGTRRSWRSSPQNVEHLQDRITFIDCDLTDASATLKAVETAKPDYLFHLAALSFVPDSWALPAKTVSDNSGMQVNLFEAIRYHKLNPMIQTALSSEEYGKVFEHELPITENNPLRPLSPYAVSKVTQDMLAYQYHQSYGLRVVRTRAFNHEGPRRGEVFVTSNFAKQVAEIEAGMKPPILYVGNLDAVRDWSDTRDIVRAYWLALNKCTPGEDYVIGSGVARTIREMLDLLLSMSKHKIEVVRDEARARPSDVVRLQCDCSKFKKATGWEPRYTFEQTMLDLLNYWRERVQQPEHQVKLEPIT